MASPGTYGPHHSAPFGSCAESGAYYDLGVNRARFIVALGLVAPSVAEAVMLEIPASLRLSPLGISAVGIIPPQTPLTAAHLAPDAPAPILFAPALAAIPIIAPVEAVPIAVAPLPALAPQEMLLSMAAADSPEQDGSGAGRVFDGGAKRRPANFDEIPPLDTRYAAPEQRARTVTILGSSKSVERSRIPSSFSREAPPLSRKPPR